MRVLMYLGAVVIVFIGSGCSVAQGWTASAIEWHKNRAFAQQMRAEELAARRQELEVERELARHERELELSAVKADNEVRLEEARAETKDVVNLKLGLDLDQEYEVVGKFIDFNELEAKHEDLQKRNEEMKKIIDRANELRKEKYLESLQSKVKNYDYLNAFGSDGQPKDCSRPSPPVLDAYSPIEMPAEGLTEEDVTWVVKIKSKSRMHKNPTLESRIRKEPSYIPCEDAKAGCCNECAEYCVPPPAAPKSGNKYHSKEPVYAPGITLSDPGQLLR